MGFLDDAIREHLELKRRRGADPADIERAEREALGPVRRHPEPLEGEPTADEMPVGEAEHDYLAEPGEEFSAAEHGYPAEHESGPPAHETELIAHDHEDIADADASPAEHQLYEPPVTPEPYVAPPPPDLTAAPSDIERPAGAHEYPETSREDDLGHDLPESVAEPEEAPAPYPAASVTPAAEEHPHLSQPTQEYEVEFDEEHEAEHPPAEGHGEDVLEETPEFLQDTPDHDRLWFEQKPPRDFDFDR